MAGNGDKWRWADPQGVQRLVHSDELRAALASGALPPYTLVWRDGMKEWQPAYQVAELATVAISAQQGVIPNIPPPPLAIVAVQAEFERRVTTDAKESAAPKKEAEPPPPPIQQYAAIASAVPTHVMQTAGRPVVQPARVAAPVAAPPEPPKVAAPEPPKQVAQLPELPLPLPHGGRSVAPPPPPRRSRSPMAPAAPSMAPPAVHASSAPKKTLLGLSGPSSLVPPSDPVLASQNGGHVDAASMPSLPPHPSVRSAELNGSADDGPISDLPAFPLDEIDPDSVQTDGVFGSAPGGGASEEEARASADDDDPHLPLEKGIGSKIAETFREAEKSLRPFAVRAKEGLRPLAARAKVGTTKIGPAITRGARYIQENPKDPKVVAGLAGAAVLVLLMLVVIAASTGADAHDVAGAALPASSVASPLAASSERAAQPNVATTATVTTATAPTASAASSPPASCRLRREGIKIAAKASKDVPVEIVMTADGDRARIGFANDANAAQGLSVDLASLKFFPEFAARAGGKVRAVVPLFSHGKPVFAVNAESKRDRLQAWRMLSADPPITVGWADNTIATAARPGDPPAAIWPLEGDGVPDTIRAVDANEAGIAVVFRRKGEIFAGMVGRDRTPRGGLVKIAGAGAPAGSPVGAPAIALSGSTIAVAFADRASPQDPWAVRIGTAPLGSFPKDTSGFVLPPGGPGGAAIAPALAGISDGRWLLVWTEGSGGEHVVRAQTVDDAFKPVGAPFALSHEGGNAGQGAVALRNGQGLAAYLALTDHGYELWGAPIDCR